MKVRCARGIRRPTIRQRDRLSGRTVRQCTLHCGEPPAALLPRTLDFGPKSVDSGAPKREAQMDLRTYGVGAQILRDLNVGRMRLLSRPRRMPSRPACAIASKERATVHECVVSSVAIWSNSDVGSCTRTSTSSSGPGELSRFLQKHCAWRSGELSAPFGLLTARRSSSAASTTVSNCGQCHDVNADSRVLRPSQPIRTEIFRTALALDALIE